MRQIILVCVAVIGACGNPDKSPVVEKVDLGVKVRSDYPEWLSEWRLFAANLDALNPTARVFSYELNAPLFTDYAHKARFIRLPEGGTMTYDGDEVFDFSEGAVLIKNFFYPSDFAAPEKGRRILETRLLVKEPSGWQAISYQWNEEQTDARRLLLGATVPVQWTDSQGGLQRINYQIPSQPQCKSCHELNGKMMPIGPSARQLNKHDQLTNWIEEGRLRAETVPESFPKLADYSNDDEALDRRARAWLEVNCAHCHRREGPAKNSGLYLLASEKDAFRMGINKPPVAAGKGSGGLRYGIVPGHPEQSILLHRIESQEPGEMMPELGRTLTHKEGIQLIREWILTMEEAS